MIYPCYCRGCGIIGTTFCDCCFFNNIRENPPFFTSNDRDFVNIFACGIRTGQLSKLVSDYKFYSRRHYARVLARYLDETISRLSPGVEYVLIPLPTIERHIRERGFDHMKRICKDFADLTGFWMSSALTRANSTVQVGSDAKTRLKQAKGAYKINPKVTLDLKSHFLLVDDVWTTGASMRAARDVLEAELLRLGAKKAEIKISAICLAKNDGYEF